MSENVNSLMERRASERTNVQVRVSVLGVDQSTAVHTETAETLDVSATGIRVPLSYPIRIGDHFSINTNSPQLNARMAVFVVRWIQRQGERFVVGGQLVSPSENWQLYDV